MRLAEGDQKAEMGNFNSLHDEKLEDTFKDPRAKQV